MSFTPDIQIFCCHYTSQQAIAEGAAGLKEDGFPENASINRVTCGGKLQVSALLKAFEDGADGVVVISCPVDECHNVMGSQRAARRAVAVRKAIEELGVEGERVEMYQLPRGFHPEFVEAARKMDEVVRALGASPFTSEEKAPAKKAPAKKAAAKKAPAKKVATKKTAAKKAPAKKAAAKPAAKKTAAKKTTVKKSAAKPAAKKAASKPARKKAAKPAAKKKTAAKKGGKKK
jgi:coenzyme F420-reducing hydrogenase delta subunit